MHMHASAFILQFGLARHLGVFHQDDDDDAWWGRGVTKQLGGWRE